METQAQFTFLSYMTDTQTVAMTYSKYWTYLQRGNTGDAL